MDSVPHSVYLCVALFKLYGLPHVDCFVGALLEVLSLFLYIFFVRI
uniref:Uncharacterized protein n=1 Tax=Anguilla anguilla TaxID=7936 RepID=A0A0E9WUB2_ANGAN